MYRLSYKIGSRTLDDILPYFQKDVDTDKDVIVVVRLDGDRKGAIIISKTEIGESFITFFYLKHRGNPLVEMMKL